MTDEPIDTYYAVVVGGDKVAGVYSDLRSAWEAADATSGDKLVAGFELSDSVNVEAVPFYG